MGNLFEYEFRRLFRSVSFYVCTILMAAFVVITLASEELLVSMMMDGMSGYINGNQGLFVAMAGCKSTLILPILISIFVCSEYVEGTIRNVIGHGISRTKKFFNTYLVCITAVLIMDVFVLLCGFVTGIVCGGLGNGYTLRYFLTMLLQLLGSLAYTTMFYFFAVWVRKTGSSILMGIFVPSLVSLVLGIVDMFDLVPFAFSDYTIEGAFTTVDSGTIVTQSDMLTVLIVCLVHIAVFLLVGWRIAKRQEV